MNYISFFAALLVSISVSCQSKSTNTQTNASGATEVKAAALKNVHIQEAGALAQSGQAIQILDVRTPEEWAGGTIKGATKMNLQNPDFAAQVSKLDKNQPVLVYCAAGARSARASAIMSQMGFTQVFNMTEGFSAWKSAGLPVE